jgi:hypothetical protein
MPEIVVRVDSKAVPFSAPDAEGAWSPLLWAPDDALPDVSCFLRRSGNLVEGELAVGNVSIVPGKPAKAARTSTIAVEPGSGWSIVWDLERPWPTLYPIGRETWRRFCLHRADDPGSRAEAERRARGVFHPEWEKRKLAFGPTNMPLPRLAKFQAAAIEGIDATRLETIRKSLAALVPFTVDDREDAVFAFPGGHSPLGPRDGGSPGGSGIQFATGWRQNPKDLEIAVLVAPCEHARMLRYARRDTGAILSVDDYPNAPYSPDLWGGPLPETVGVANDDPLPPPYDFAHEIRGSRRTIQLTEQLDSPMAKRSLAGVAAVARMRFSERGRMPPVEGYFPVNVASLLQQARSFPHTGVWGSTAGRQIGWAAFENAQCIKVNGGSSGQRKWAADFLDLMEVAETPAGVFQKAWGNPFPEKVDAQGKKIFCMQTFEYVILAYGACGLAIQTGSERGKGVFLKGFAQIYGPATKVPILKYYHAVGPWKFIDTADETGAIRAELSDGSPASEDVVGDATHAEAAIALAHHLTGDPAWIERMRLYNAGFATWKKKLAALTSRDATEIDWQAFAVAQMQRRLQEESK